MSVTVRRDVVYRQVPGFRAQSLDLYRPAQARVLCAYFHGGGWRVGSRRAGPGPLSPESGRRFERLASQGIAVASCDYRLSGEAHFPAQLHDTLAACRWLLDDCADVAGLPLVVFGVSAGGHLAALAALEGSLPIRAAALWYAVTDLTTMPASSDPSTREAMLLGAPVSKVASLAEAASPVCQVREGAPPFLLIHGDADQAVPMRQSVVLESALCAVGSSAELLTVEGYDHMFTGMPEADVDALLDRTAAFFLGLL